MKATIRIDSNEIEAILRAHILKLVGINKITGIHPIVEYNRMDEQSIYTGHDIEVDLKEIPSK